MYKEYCTTEVPQSVTSVLINHFILLYTEELVTCKKTALDSVRCYARVQLARNE